MSPLSGKSVYIVGPRNLQNNLMASFLGPETGSNCIALEHFGDIPDPANDGKGQPRLVLWDCLGKDLKTCLSDFDEQGGNLFAQDFLGLFNVSNGLGIEEEAVARGARGFFYEQDPFDVFLKGIRAIFDGELWVSRKILSECISRENPYSMGSKGCGTVLTDRETQILSLVAKGNSNKDIADRLHISRHTVKTHLYNIFKKINVPNRLHATLWAAKNT